jgi:hypothetical protein
MKKVPIILSVVLLLLILVPGTARQVTPPRGSAVVRADLSQLNPGSPTSAPMTGGGCSTTPKISAHVDFGKMPVSFIPNRGQMDKQVAYYVQGKDKTLYFTAEGITMTLAMPSPHKRAEARAAAEGRKPDQASNLGLFGRKAPGTDAEARFGKVQEAGTGRYVVTLDFIGANNNVTPVGEDETGGVVSYFKGKPKDWQAGLPTYSRIAYRNLWPGIDLVYRGTVGRLKYEFIVHPGADPSMIRLSYRGAEGISVDQAGRLNISTPAGSFQDDVPAAYQEADGRRKDVRLAYRLMAASPCAYGFEVGAYDHSQTLILDPALFVYCGFIGGSLEDEGNDIAVDDSGNLYVTGTTWSTEATFPVTVGPDLTYTRGYDAYVAKINSQGTALLYCGYIGGSGTDYGYGIAVDALGNALITGSTGSTESSFPVTIGPDLTYNGTYFYDGFVAKVNAAGTALVYCGYIGGDSYDYGRGVAVDASGSAYVTGYTRSTEGSFPVTLGPDLTYNGGGYDAFVAKVNPEGTAFAYCGYIGGASDDRSYGIAVDAWGSAYVTGFTSSSEGSFPVTFGPDLTYNGLNDAFVAKVNPEGTALAYCGYIGGDSYDSGSGIALDSSGNAYLTGSASSTESSFPVTVGPDLTYNGGGSDAFVAKVGGSGTALIYCGYIGGASSDGCSGIALDAAGNAYVAGVTSSDQSTFPVTGGPELSFGGGGSDAFVAIIAASGASLPLCGYIGGAGADTSAGIALDKQGDIHIVGETNSTGATFPVLVGPDLTENGDYDAFVAKIFAFQSPSQKSATGDYDGDGADELAMIFPDLGAWMFNGGSWTQLTLSNPVGLIAADVDNDLVDEIVADLSHLGLWTWKNGVWNQISAHEAEAMAKGDIDGDGAAELASDFGALGVWLWSAKSGWTQLTGMDAASVIMADLDGTGSPEVIGDFGATGLWRWGGGSWTQLSGASRAYWVTPAGTGGPGAEDLVASFESAGLWRWTSGAWTVLSGVRPDYVIGADLDHDGFDEVLADYGLLGLWVWRAGVWNQLSGANPEYMISADLDGDGDEEAAVDFADRGLWVFNGGSWLQISGATPDTMLSGDLDGDGIQELVADFGATGLWLWNQGAWSRISPLNPEQIRTGGNRPAATSGI